jgi:hypothetical protein
MYVYLASSSYGSTAQIGPWPPRGFVTITFLRGWSVSPAPNPQPGGRGLRIYDPGDRVAQLYPQHWVHILVAFYDMNGLQWDYSLIPATTREGYLAYSHKI